MRLTKWDGMISDLEEAAESLAEEFDGEFEVIMAEASLEATGNVLRSISHALLGQRASGVALDLSDSQTKHTTASEIIEEAVDDASYRGNLSEEMLAKAERAREELHAALEQLIETLETFVEDLGV